MLCIRPAVPHTRAWLKCRVLNSKCSSVLDTMATCQKGKTWVARWHGIPNEENQVWYLIYICPSNYYFQGLKWEIDLGVVQ